MRWLDKVLTVRFTVSVSSPSVGYKPPSVGSPTDHPPARAGIPTQKGGDAGGGTHIFLKSRNVIIKMTYVMQTPPQGPGCT
eukprot:9496499-Pyramimonas_sp.AAC.1